MSRHHCNMSSRFQLGIILSVIWASSGCILWLAGGGSALESLVGRQRELTEIIYCPGDERFWTVEGQTYQPGPRFIRGNTTGALTVLFMIGGSAEPGRDFEIPSAALNEHGAYQFTFADGVADYQMQFRVIDDDEPEATEYVVLHIIDTTDYRLAAGYGDTVIEIADNETIRR
jgi:hypothetical protein